ncbi:MAG: hypothetical protein EOM34_16885 [Clostridia bacterium]|nr:hypothetical protein [Clostridia bacterium]NCD04315.1 hypothetical protein [Clostridia bacterium]
MEFGLVAAFGMIYTMLAYLKTKDKKDIILFAGCISWTLMAHFYVTILCLVVCLCFGIIFIIPICRKKLLLRYIAGGLAGVLLACIPYIWGFLTGYEFERSIAWAFGVVQTTAASEQDEAEETLSEEREQTSISTTVKNIFRDEAQYLSMNYVTRRRIARGLMFMDVLLAVYAVAGICFSKKKTRYMGYLFWAMLWEVSAILACTYYLNLPTIIEVKRMATFLSFLTIPLFCLPFEAAFQSLRICKVKEQYLEPVFAAAATIGLCGFFTVGEIKQERYYSITIAEGDMRTALDLCENYKDNTWTIISPTNDLSVVRYDGFHHEIVDLIKDLDGGEDHIYIPTPEIYVVTEEKPISFANDRREIDRSDVTATQNVKTISGQAALRDVDWTNQEDGLHGADAPYYFQREVVMSKLYYWIKAIQQIYPKHVAIFYEDEQVTVYKITQDPYFTLNLSVDYKTLAEKDAEVGK